MTSGVAEAESDGDGLSAPELVHGLLELSGALVAVQPFDDRLHNVCAHTAGLLDTDRVSIFLRDGDHYRARFNHGNPPDIAEVFPTHRVRLDDALIAEAVRTRSFVLVPDALDDARMNRAVALVAGIQAMAVVALFDGHEPIGFMTAEYNQRARVLTETQAALFTGVARLVQSLVLLDRADRAAYAAAREAASLAGEVHDLRRFEPLGRLAGGIAHDFNNTLTVILGNCDLLAERGDVGARSAEHVAAIRGAAKRAAGLTSRLLTFSRTVVSHEQAHDLVASVRSIVPMVEPLLPGNVRFEMDVGVDEAWIVADPAQLEQVVVNLVLNARDAMPGGGTIRLELMTRVHTDGDDPDGAQPTVSLAVVDEGDGIAAEDLPRVFDAFFSTKGDHGIGLGLANVRDICERAGGTVMALSRPGRTEFRVELPLASTPIASTIVGDPATAAEAGAGEVVLVVDDDVAVLDVVGRGLASFGYEVLATADPVQAEAWMSERGPEIAVLVTDVAMPRVSGPQLAVSARGHGIGDVVFMSGHPGHALELTSSDLDPPIFLQKPFAAHELAAQVARLIRPRRSPRS